MAHDDDDWVGTPPEGHHSRERANPEFWRTQWQKPVLGAGLLLVILIVLLVLVIVR